MSMDAFAVAITKGVHLKQPTFGQALQMGLVFGITEALMPMVGYFLGVLFSDFVANIDHWVSFILLMGLGLHLIYDAIFEKNLHHSNEHTKNKVAINKKDNQYTNQSSRTNTNSYTHLNKNNQFMLVLTAFATSIDAMVIGVSLAFMKANIWLSAFLIGLATTGMATIGIYLGHKLGQKIGKAAEIIGGVILMSIGSFILYTHLV